MNITRPKVGFVTVASLVSSNVVVRYNEGSKVVVTGGIILAAPSRLREIVDLSSTSTTTVTTTITTSTTFSMNISNNSSMDTANGGSSVSAIASVVASAASLTLVKTERPDHSAGTSTSPTTVATSPICAGSNLFVSIDTSNKTSRPDDWLAADSPESPQNSLRSQHVVYNASQQQITEQQQPPMAHSSPLAHQQQVSNNGYSSPMSTSSYDPYSPSGKIGESISSTKIANYSKKKLLRYSARQNYRYTKNFLFLKDYLTLLHPQAEYSALHEIHQPQSNTTTPMLTFN